MKRRKSCSLSCGFIYWFSGPHSHVRYWNGAMAKTGWERHCHTISVDAPRLGSSTETKPAAWPCWGLGLRASRPCFYQAMVNMYHLFVFTLMSAFFWLRRWCTTPQVLRLRILTLPQVNEDFLVKMMKRIFSATDTLNGNLKSSPPRLYGAPNLGPTDTFVIHVL